MTTLAGIDPQVMPVRGVCTHIRLFHQARWEVWKWARKKRKKGGERGGYFTLSTDILPYVITARSPSSTLTAKAFTSPWTMYHGRMVIFSGRTNLTISMRSTQFLQPVLATRRSLIGKPGLYLRSPAVGCLSFFYRS
jgi:hypothetical protein